MTNWMTIIFTFLIYSGAAQNYYIAHRGASHDAPENTLASVKLAWEQGADAVEVDVHLASDNRVVVIHDKDTKRTCKGKNLLVRNTPSMVLRDLDAGIWKDPKYKGERIPYLEEVMATIPEGKTLVVEVKCGSEIIPHLERIFSKGHKKTQVVFISFDWEVILDLKKAFPDNKVYWLSGARQAILKKLPEIAKEGITGVDLHFPVIDSEIVSEVKALQLELICWTVDDPAEARRLAELGISRFTTNRPGWLKQQMEN